jgi:hypothetical protein
MSGESEARLGTQLQSIDRVTLMPLVRQALGSESVEITNWDIEQIHGAAAGGYAGSSAIFRISGRGSDALESMEWSLILKALSPQPDRDQPSDYHYWRREVHAFESRLLDDLPGDLIAPQCFGIIEQDDGACWIWMEDVKEDIGPEWPLEHYGTVARHLGQFNGAYLTGRPIPCHDWLSRGWLRVYVASTAPDVAQLSDFQAHPLMSRAYPDDVAKGTLRLWQEHETLLDALDRLPQTFCHMDAFRRNLFAQHDADGCDRTVAVDWACTGTGAVGEELVPLIQAGLGLEITMNRAEEFQAMIFDGYLRGLREAGWGGDERSVRFAYSVASAMRYPFIGVGVWLRMARDEDNRARWERVMGKPVEDLADLWGALYRFELSKAGEARDLLDEL